MFGMLGCNDAGMESAPITISEYRNASGDMTEQKRREEVEAMLSISRGKP